MPSLEVSRQLQSLQSLIQRTRQATWQDIELQGHWGKYLCVLAAGFMENALRGVYLEFVNNSSSPAVARFAAASLDNVSNPKS